MHSGRKTYTGQRGAAAGDASGKFHAKSVKPNAKSSAPGGSKLASADFNKQGTDPTPRQMWRAQPKPLVPLGETAHELLYGPRREVRVGGNLLVPPPAPSLASRGAPSSPFPVDSFAKDTYARLVFSPLPNTAAAAAANTNSRNGSGEHEEIFVGDAKMDELLLRSAGASYGYGINGSSGSSSRGLNAAIALRAHQQQQQQVGGLDLGLSGADYNSTLTGTTSRRPNAQKPLPLSPAPSTSGVQLSASSVAPLSLQTDNLNTTIGRADRAAMLLGLEPKEEQPLSHGGLGHPLDSSPDAEGAAPATALPPADDTAFFLKGQYYGAGTKNLTFSNSVNKIGDLKALLKQAAAGDESAPRCSFGDGSPRGPKAGRPAAYSSPLSAENGLQFDGLAAAAPPHYAGAGNANANRNRVSSQDSNASGPATSGGGAADAAGAVPSVYATPRLQAALAKLYANTPAPAAMSLHTAKNDERGTEWYLRTESSTASLRYDALTVETIRVRFGESTTLMRAPDLFDVLSCLSIRSSAASVFEEKENAAAAAAAAAPPPLDGLRNSNRAAATNKANGNRTAVTGAAAISSSRSAVASYASLLNTPASVLASLAAAPPSYAAPSDSQVVPIATATAPSAIFKEGNGGVGGYKSGTEVLRDAVVANTQNLQTFICQKPEEERLRNKVAQWCDRCVLEEEALVDKETGGVYVVYPEDPDVQHEAAMQEVIRDEEEVRSRKLLTRQRLDQQSKARRESVMNAVSMTRGSVDSVHLQFNTSNSWNTNTKRDSFLAVGAGTQRPSVLGTTALTIDAQKSLTMLRHGAAVQPHSQLTSYFNPFDVDEDEDEDNEGDGHNANAEDGAKGRFMNRRPSPSQQPAALASGLAAPLTLPGVLLTPSVEDATGAAAAASSMAFGEGSVMHDAVRLTATEKYLLELVVLSILPCCPLDHLLRLRQQHASDFLGQCATVGNDGRVEEGASGKKTVGARFYLEQTAPFTRNLALLREVNTKLRREAEDERRAAAATASASGPTRKAADEVDDATALEEVPRSHVLPLRLFFCSEGDHLFHAHSLSADAVVEVDMDALELLLLLPEAALTTLYHSAFDGNGNGNSKSNNQSRSRKRGSSTYGNNTYRDELLYFSAAAAPASCQLAWHQALRTALVQHPSKSLPPSSTVGYALDSFSVDVAAAVAASRWRVAALKRSADVFLRHKERTARTPTDGQSESLPGETANAAVAAGRSPPRSPDPQQQSPFNGRSPPLPPPPASTRASVAEKRRASVAGEWGAETGWEEPVEGGPPMIGHTPVIPGKRELFGCDMQNLHLLATLAAEEMQQVLSARLQRLREQYQEQLAAMGDGNSASVATGGGGDDGGNGGASTSTGNAAGLGKRRTVVFSTSAVAGGGGENAAFAGRSSQSFAGGRSDATAGEAKVLSKALDEWRSVFALYEVEVEYAKGLFALYADETKIHEYNGQVRRYNEFQERQKRIWGPLYRSGLCISYLVCKFLSVYGLKNLPENFVYLLHPVAMFVGCTGGHREMRLKLPEVLLDIVERAKRVRLPVESIPLKERGEMILQEAAAAVAAREGNASDVVTCLATEADVLRLALQFVPVPETCALSVPPLDTALRS